MAAISKFYSNERDSLMLKMTIVAGLVVAATSFAPMSSASAACDRGFITCGGWCAKYKRVGCSCAHKAQGAATCVRDEPIGEAPIMRRRN
jgi:hypothetical protein